MSDRHLPDDRAELRDHHSVDESWQRPLRTDVVYSDEHTLSDSTAIYLEDAQRADEWILSDTFYLLTGEGDCGGISVTHPNE